jgi:hypothetical protein
MGLIELIVTVCALSLPSQCEDLHLSFSAGMVRHECAALHRAVDLEHGKLRAEIVELSVER